MKKMILLGALMTLCTAAVGHAQESRQDASISLFGVYAPAVYGLNIHPMTTTSTGGFLASYRYLLTPRSAVELNYSFDQNSMKYNTDFAAEQPGAFARAGDQLPRMCTSGRTSGRTRFWKAEWAWRSLRPSWTTGRPRRA